MSAPQQRCNLSADCIGRVKIYVYRPTGSTERCATEGATTIPPHTTLGLTTSAQHSAVGADRNPKVRAGGQTKSARHEKCTLCAAVERREMGSKQSACRVRNPPRALH